VTVSQLTHCSSCRLSTNCPAYNNISARTTQNVPFLCCSFQLLPCTYACFLSQSLPSNGYTCHNSVIAPYWSASCASLFMQSWRHPRHILPDARTICVANSFTLKMAIEMLAETLAKPQHSMRPAPTHLLCYLNLMLCACCSHNNIV
jgi:hypothetical protein